MGITARQPEQLPLDIVKTTMIPLTFTCLTLTKIRVPKTNIESVSTFTLPPPIFDRLRFFFFQWLFFFY